MGVETAGQTAVHSLNECLIDPGVRMCGLVFDPA